MSGKFILFLLFMLLADGCQKTYSCGHAAGGRHTHSCHRGRLLLTMVEISNEINRYASAHEGQYPESIDQFLPPPLPSWIPESGIQYAIIESGYTLMAHRPGDALLIYGRIDGQRIECIIDLRTGKPVS